MKSRLGIVLLAMGGPDTTADIPEFLYNIFSDRSIIRLPGGSLLQKPFARLISRLRSKGVAHHYDQIGGGSPLMKWTDIQARIIAGELREDFPEVRCYIGMRYFGPSIQSAITSAVRDGCNRLCFLPMYPQYSYATTGSSFLVARQVLSKLPNTESVFINDFHDRDDYVRLLNSYIEENISANETLLFSAHSLPQKFVEEGDPYVDQIMKTAKLAAGKRDYHISFQSRTGPVKWVGPDTIDEVKRLLQDPNRRLFIVPISFVCDHIETLYELDIQLGEIVGSDLAKRMRRMPMFNADPQFGKMLADLVRSKIGEDVHA